jgi:hypothetical protein
MDVESGGDAADASHSEFDDIDADESDEPVPKAKKAPQKVVSLAFDRLRAMPLTLLYRPRRKVEKGKREKQQR